jgi:hypothetical protein
MLSGDFKMKIHLFTAITAAAMLCGCNFCTEVPLMNIEYAENITINGIVDEKCWQNAQQYDLGVSGSAMEYKHPSLAKHYGNRVLSPGYVKMLHNRNYLYISAVMQDDDIIAYGKRDQQIHCTEGDVFEIFLKPENANHYWEIHITPAGHCAVLFYPSRGYHFLPGIVMPSTRPLKKIKYKVNVNGTLNKNTDKDKFWSVEAAIPLAELAAAGVPFDAQNQWRILFGRYNFSKYQTLCELTSFPKLSKIDFHIHEEYGKGKIKN